jgi:hypothetical protein
MPRPSRLLLAAVLLTPACGHTDPFTTPPLGSDTPFDASPPQRLTYNALADRWVAWLPDGSGLLYSAQQGNREDRDVCLALLPPTGGRQRQLWCDVPGGNQTTDAIESADASVAGRLAFLGASGTLGEANPEAQEIAVAPLLDPTVAQRVRIFPFTPAGGASQSTAAYVRWLDESRLAFVGQTFHIRLPCFGCLTDTIRIGQAVTVLDVDAASEPVAIPTTQRATSVASGGDGSVLYTLEGSSQVFRYTIATAQFGLVFDFGSSGIARDVHLVGNRLTAIVGGRIALAPDPDFGQVQWDSGGVIHVVDLDTGNDFSIAATDRLYRRPVLAPAGGQLVAEGYPLIVVGTDTAVSRAGDLYLFGAP